MIFKIVEPEMSHSVLNIEVTEGARTYVVGDVHGCHNELMELETKLRKLCHRSGISCLKIISLGDLCDRGPDSANVIEHFARGKEAGTHDLILGNHETFFLLAFAGLRPDLLKEASIKFTWYHEQLFKLFRAQMTSVASWRQNGGRLVFESYNADIDNPDTWGRIPKSHLKLLFEAPLVFRSPKVLISHALMGIGDIDILAARDRGEEVDEKALSGAVLRCLWEREYPEARLIPDKRHISGHTPLTTVVRDPKAGTIQIDTGAVYGGSLTAIDINSLRTAAVKSNYSCRIK